MAIIHFYVASHLIILYCICHWFCVQFCNQHLQ